MTREEFITAFISAPDSRARRFLLEANADHVHLDTVQALKAQADTMERDDARRALHVGQITEELADSLATDEGRAVAAWIQANAQDLLADLETAAGTYARAAGYFRTAGKPLEAARTGLGHMEALAKLGRFDQAQAVAEAARSVFIEHEDLTSQATLDMNLANLHYRRGNYSAALESSRRATSAFQSLGNDLYAAMNQCNQANILTVLDDFLGAELLYEQAKPVFEVSDLRTAVASVDLNLAILQGYRGNYSRAFQTFEQARSIFSSLAMHVNLAMTDLEESDLHLELNLPGRALQLAERAETAFNELQMTFETARAKVNCGIALARLQQLDRAAALLAEASQAFTDQENPTWIAHTDLQRAQVMRQLGERQQARLSAEQAARAYEQLGIRSKQSYAHILCADLWADDGNWERALEELETAVRALSDVAAPWLGPRIETCRGRIHEGMGERSQAIQHYVRAAQLTEQTMAALTAEEHRTAFIADKLQPYESLIALHASTDPALAFQWAEQAKSRALVDLLAAGVRPRLRIRDEMDARHAQRLQELREELNWLYTRLMRGEAPGDPSAPAAAPETWVKIQEREQEAGALWHQLQARHAEELSLLKGSTLSAAEVQARLPEHSAILEYFVARGGLIAFFLTKREIQAFPLTVAMRDVMALMEELSFQFSKFQYGPAYYERHRPAMQAAVQGLLDRLGVALLSPLAKELSQVEAVIIVPHGALHAVPFPALRQGARFLLETHSVSFAPSAAVLNYCWNRSAARQADTGFAGPALLVGVPDERATHVSQEIQALATLMKDGRVFLGDEATLARVSEAARGCGLLHLAAHGMFRPEAPLLSSIRLADRWMAVQDVYDLDLRASLVTLSACETGLGHDMGGDEMVGLVRGFLHAGAASLLVSLWMVDDKSMTELIKRFYTHWLAGEPKAHALRKAQLELMGQYEHPYFWAPMVLVGNEK